MLPDKCKVRTHTHRRTSAKATESSRHRADPLGYRRGGVRPQRPAWGCRGNSEEGRRRAMGQTWHPKKKLPRPQRGQEQSGHAGLGQANRRRKDQGFLDIILTGVVYTPYRAHLRWGKSGQRPACNHPLGDWRHYVDHCSGIRHKVKCPGHFPDCLRYAGTVPNCWAQTPSSLQMSESETWTQGAAIQFRRP